MSLNFYTMIFMAKDKNKKTTNKDRKSEGNQIF